MSTVRTKVRTETDTVSTWWALVLTAPRSIRSPTRALYAATGVVEALLLNCYVPIEVLGGWNIPGVIPAAALGPPDVRPHGRLGPRSDGAAQPP